MTRGAGLALTVVAKARSAAPAVAAPLVGGPNRLARSVLGADTVPLHSAELPGGGPARARPMPVDAPEAVYFPACVQTMFGPADSTAEADGVGRGRGVQYSFEQLCERAGITLLAPEGIDALCCGTPWSPKGTVAGQDSMGARTLAALRAATLDGELPVICDASSCTEGLLSTIQREQELPGRRPLRVLDAVAFAAERILPRLPEHPKPESLALHPTCSSTRLGLDTALTAGAEADAAQVDVPENWGCCAFAGDRGMLHPELTASFPRSNCRRPRSRRKLRYSGRAGVPGRPQPDYARFRDGVDCGRGVRAMGGVFPGS